MKHHVSSTLDDSCQECTLETHSPPNHLRGHDERVRGHKTSRTRMTTRTSRTLRNFSTTPHAAIPVTGYSSVPDQKEPGHATTRGRPKNRTELGTERPCRFFTNTKNLVTQSFLATTTFEQGTLKQKGNYNTHINANAEFVTVVCNLIAS